MYMSLNSDPTQSHPDEYLRTLYSGAGLGSGSGLGPPRLPPGVAPIQGCPPLPDGRPNRYCWSINWVPFQVGC